MSAIRKTDQEILEAIRPLVKSGRIACKDALESARALKVPPARIGRICNAEGIRIVNCQLGCFGLRRSKPR
jgi:hypothetical protein